ncbi:vasotab-like [Ischnura elegans]|uniref:vasotab-like n=1 Tax=Ischnura elegans TaxID=197161 RepID=UPI001ED8789A|nr:vasotab-like [Ischnura elegans]
MKSAIVITFAVVLSVALLCSAEEQLDACPDVCSSQTSQASRQPVCGRNLAGERRTFDSQCKLNVYNCKNRNNRYNLVYRKACTN